MSFTKRVISLRFRLGTGSFGKDGTDTVEIEGLRCSANIVHEGIGFAHADVQIWGMPLDLMNKLTVLNALRYEEFRYNDLIISAGDEDSVSTVFGGSIRQSWVDGRQAPDVVFQVSADSGAFALMQSSDPASYRGPASASLMISQIAAKIGYDFENGGVNGVLNNQYLPGTPKAQIEKICQAVGCQWSVDDAKKVISIWPKDGVRPGVEITISPETGLVGYPSFTQAGIQFTTLYNPSIEFGRAIEMKSQFVPANGHWKAQGVAHRLEANIPGGQWFTDVECIYLDFKA